MKTRASILVFGLLGVIPLAAGLCYAIAYASGLTGALSHGFTLEYWQKALFMPELWKSLMLSLAVTAVVICGSFVLSIQLTTGLRDRLQTGWPRFFLQAPLAIPPMVAAFVTFQWAGNSGMLARLAIQAGFIQDPLQFPELINDAGQIGIVTTLLLGAFPFILLLMLDHYRRADLEALSALAATLGASDLDVKRKVLVPILIRRMAPTLLMYGVFLLGSYEVPLLLGRQNPAMISVLISQKFKKFNLDDLPVAYAETVVYALLTLLAVVIYWTWNKRKNTEAL